MIDIVAHTGSTNSDMLARLKAGEHVREGDWLVAERQSAGRGRQGREWFDGHGNFMGSTVVHVEEASAPASSLALMSGVALYETLLGFVPEPGALALKWPNDTLLNGAKLAGILLESWQSSVVIGIGVNLRAAPQLRARRTIALAQVTPPPALTDFAAALARSFDTELARWRQLGLPSLLRRWQACAHPIGTAMQVHEGSGVMCAGRFAGLADDGGLRLRLSNGTEQIIQAGDIVLREGED